MAEWLVGTPAYPEVAGSNPARCTSRKLTLGGDPYPACRFTGVGQPGGKRIRWPASERLHPSTSITPADPPSCTNLTYILLYILYILYIYFLYFIFYIYIYII